MRHWLWVLMLLLLISGALAAEIDPRIADALEHQEEVKVVVFEDKAPEGRVFAKSVKAVASKRHVEYLSEDELSALESRPGIAKVFLDRKAHAFLDESVPLVNADTLWNITSNGSRINGSGESVCVIDTGVNADHADLVGKVVAERCFCEGCCPNGNDTDVDAEDDHGHGTHVSGIIASQNAVYKGVAPGASIVAVKVLDSGGDGYFSDILSGIEWCVNESGTYNISVISMSLGDNTRYTDAADCYGDILSDSIESALDAGILVVAASGNEGFTNGLAYPACDPNVTSVGSVTKSDIVVSSSNSATFLDLLAPGNGITSLNYLGGTLTMGGTSMATPHVSGVAAMLQQLALVHDGSHKTPQELRTILDRNGPNITDWRNSLVHHRLDALLAAGDLVNNSAPTINDTFPTSISLSIVEPNNRSFAINASDPESQNITIRWYLNGMVVENGTAFNFTGNYSSAGTYNITVIVTDTFHSNDSFSWSLEVNNTNRFPSLINKSPNTTSLSIAEPYDQSFSINVSDPDNESISYAWFLNGTSVGSTRNYTWTGNYSQAGTYNISVIASDLYNASVNTSWSLTVNNTNRAPSITLTLTPNSPSTTNALTCNYSYSDLDGDTANWTLIRWFTDDVENMTLENITTLGPGNTSKGENWTCVVTTNDGNLSSTPVNVSAIILNSLPAIAGHANITILETQTANITIAASDDDNDSLSYFINDSRFSQSINNFSWTSNLSSSGTFLVKINVSDDEENSSITITVTVVDAPDYDNDGNPNFNDTDDDNDGLNDSIDYVTGNVSNVNTSSNLSIEINGSTDLNQTFTGTLNLTIKEGAVTIINATYNFSNGTVLDLYNLTIDSDNGSIVIRGLPGVVGTKDARISDANTTITAVCILDTTAPSLDDISADCNAGNETLVLCDGTLQNGYTCTDEGAYYHLTGLSHSAVQEQCVDTDSDGYLTASCGGNDCDDDSFTIKPGATDVCGDSIDQDCSGSDRTCADGGSGGGGGGGGGGGTPEEKVDSVEHTWFGIAVNQTLTFKVRRENISIHNLSFTANQEAQEITVKIVEHENASAPESIVPFQVLEIDEGGADAIADEFIVTFRIPKEWLRSNGFFSEDVRFYRMEDSWKEYAVTAGEVDPAYEYFSVSLPGLSLFLIGAEKEVVERRATIAEEEEPAPEVIENDTEEPEAVTAPEPEEESFPVIIIGLVILALIATVLTVRRGGKEVQDKLKHLEDYVTKHLHQGHKPHAIAHHLISHGWPEKHVRSVFKKLRIKWYMPSPEETKGMAHPLEPLKQYVKKCLDKGYHPDRIKLVLVKAGWDKKTVKKVLR